MNKAVDLEPSTKSQAIEMVSWPNKQSQVWVWNSDIGSVQYGFTGYYYFESFGFDTNHLKAYWIDSSKTKMAVCILQPELSLSFIVVFTIPTDIRSKGGSFSVSSDDGKLEAWLLRVVPIVDMTKENDGRLVPQTILNKWHEFIIMTKQERGLMKHAYLLHGDAQIKIQNNYPEYFSIHLKSHQVLPKFKEWVEYYVQYWDGESKRIMVELSNTAPDHELTIQELKSSLKSVASQLQGYKIMETQPPFNKPAQLNASIRGRWIDNVKQNGWVWP